MPQKASFSQVDLRVLFFIEFSLRLCRFPSREAAVAALERERVPVAPILTLNEAIAHPHLRERGTVRKVKDPYIGEFDIPGMPVKMSAWPAKTEVKAAMLGQDNEDVLSTTRTSCEGRYRNDE